MSALLTEAKRLGITPPTAATLKRYGLTADAWLVLLAGQGWKCPICERRVAQWNVDHEHVAGWKAMPPAQRVRYVRGILCVHCNYRMVPSRLPGEVAQRVATYIVTYERRRDGS